MTKSSSSIFIKILKQTVTQQHQLLKLNLFFLKNYSFLTDNKNNNNNKDGEDNKDNKNNNNNNKDNIKATPRPNYTINGFGYLDLSKAGNL